MLYYTLITTILSLVIISSSFLNPNFISWIGIDTIKLFGLSAILLLWITLMIKPSFTLLTTLAKKLKAENKTCRLISRKQKIVSRALRYRRGFGISTFLLAFTHAGLFLSIRIQKGFFLQSIGKPFAILGLSTLFLLFIGYLTSNDFSMKILKKNWKKLQQIAYIALLLAGSHMLVINFQENFWILILIIIYLGFKIRELRLSKKK